MILIFLITMLSSLPSFSMQGNVLLTTYDPQQKNSDLSQYKLEEYKTFEKIINNFFKKEFPNEVLKKDPSFAQRLKEYIEQLKKHFKEENNKKNSKKYEAIFDDIANFLPKLSEDSKWVEIIKNKHCKKDIIDTLSEKLSNYLFESNDKRIFKYIEHKNAFKFIKKNYLGHLKYKAYCKIGSYETQKALHDKKSLPELLSTLGKLRYKVNGFKEFGMPLKNVRLLDPMVAPQESDGFVSWFEDLNKKMQTILANQKLTHEHFPGGHIDLKSLDCSGIPSGIFFTSHEENNIIKRTIRQPHENYRFDGKNHFIISSANVTDFGSFLGYYGTLLNDQNSNEPSHYSMIVFRHSLQSANNSEKLQEIFQQLGKNEVNGLDELKKLIANFLFYYSHSSTFARGQASIGDWLVKGFAAYYGYKLSFNKWIEKTKMSPDMHAMNGFEKEKFQEIFLKYVEFTLN